MFLENNLLMHQSALPKAYKQVALRYIPFLVLKIRKSFFFFKSFVPIYLLNL